MIKNMRLKKVKKVYHEIFCSLGEVFSQVLHHFIQNPEMKIKTVYIKAGQGNILLKDIITL